MRRFCLAVAALVCLLNLASAEIVVNGRAIDENGAGIPRVPITVRSPSGEVQQITTDATGSFRLRVPSGGRYLFSATEAGYLPVNNLAVELHSNAPEVTVVLNHAKEVLQSLDVSGAPEPVDIEQTQSERQLSGIQILDVPYPSTHSLREALRLMPGQVEDPFGGLHFDGGRENQTNYLLDGFNVSDPLTGNLNTRVSVEAVESLDYLSGRYSPEYGKGSAGTLQIKTETGDDRFRYSSTNFIPGVNSQQGLHLGAWTPRVNFSGPIRKGRAWFSDNLDADYNISIAPGVPRKQDTTTNLLASNMLHTQINLTPANILYADFLYNYQAANEFGLSALNPPSTTLNQRNHTWLVGIKDQIYVARGTLLELGYAAMLTNARQNPEGIGTYNIMPNGTSGYYFVDSSQNSRRDQFLGNLFLPARHLAGSHQLKVGFDVDRLSYSQDISRTGYNLYGESGGLLRSVVFAGNGKFSKPGLYASSYVTDRWQVRQKLFLELGVRQDWDDILSRFEWSPRAAFSFAPAASGNTRISGGYAVVYDPTIIQLFARPLDQYTLTNIYSPSGALLFPKALSVYSIPNPRLPAPRFQNWSLGLDHQFPHRIKASFSLLRRRGDKGFAYVNAIPAPVIAPPDIAATYGASYVEQIFQLTNTRRDQYDAAQVIVHQPIRGRYEWMASYTRSRAWSTAALDPRLEQTLLIGPDNSGPLPWDSPNRFLSWGYLPTFFNNWAVAYLLEERSGFPFSIRHDNGKIIGAPDSRRFPAYFNLNLHLEWRTHLGKYRFAIRGGINNLTGHGNYSVVNNTVESPKFLTYYGSDGRHYVVRLRWLGRE